MSYICVQSGSLELLRCAGSNFLSADTILKLTSATVALCWKSRERYWGTPGRNKSHAEIDKSQVTLQVPCEVQNQDQVQTSKSKVKCEAKTNKTWINSKVKSQDKIIKSQVRSGVKPLSLDCCRKSNPNPLCFTTKSTVQQRYTTSATRPQACIVNWKREGEGPIFHITSHSAYIRPIQKWLIPMNCNILLHGALLSESVHFCQPQHVGSLCRACLWWTRAGKGWVGWNTVQQRKHWILIGLDSADTDRLKYARISHKTLQLGTYLLKIND